MFAQEQGSFSEAWAKQIFLSFAHGTVLVLQMRIENLYSLNLYDPKLLYNRHPPFDEE
jgi:hypothetical protein